MTTSLPPSASLLARSITIEATLTWCLVSSSKVEYMTSDLLRLLFISVTSSGLSSTSRTISSISGYLSSMEAAIFLRRTVLPALGWATISPLCPLPIGATRSITLVERSMLEFSSTIFSSGNIGVRSSKCGLLFDAPGSMPLTALT